ncbi:MAG: YciI family protein [Nitrospiraceae bacterium]
MKFVILGFDGPNGEAGRKIHRPAHLARLEPLDAQGRVVLAGPFTDKAGSLIIIEAESLEEAEAFAQSDPYVQFGIFERVEIHPFMQVFPKAALPR